MPTPPPAGPDLRRLAAAPASDDRVDPASPRKAGAPRVDGAGPAPARGAAALGRGGPLSEGPDAPDADAAAAADARLGAALLAIDPAGLGGVRLRAGPGPGRDAWLARLIALLPPDAPLRRTPAQADDARLLGGLDLAATLGAGHPVRRPGALAEAHGGLVLLATAERAEPRLAALIGAALDAGAVPGPDGAPRPARFALVALDEGAGPDEAAPAALRERLAFDLRPGAGIDADGLRGLLDAPAPADAPDAAEVAAARRRLGATLVPPELTAALAEAAAALGVASPRALLFALRTARASAALAGRPEAAAEDAACAARLVLGPRATQRPAAPPEEPPAPEPPPESPPDDAPPPPEPDAAAEPEDAAALGALLIEAARAALPAGLLAGLTGAAARRGAGGGATGPARRSDPNRGRPVGVKPGRPEGGARLDLIATLRAAAPWQTLRRRAAAAAAAARAVAAAAPDPDAGTADAGAAAATGSARSRDATAPAGFAPQGVGMSPPPADAASGLRAAAEAVDRPDLQMRSARAGLGSTGATATGAPSAAAALSGAVVAAAVYGVSAGAGPGGAAPAAAAPHGADTPGAAPTRAGAGGDGPQGAPEPAAPSARPPRVLIRREDFRLRRHRRPAETLTLFVVDASGSAAAARLGEAKGAVELLLAESYARRDRVALVSFRGVSAELALSPTRALARARRALGDLPGGGGTPLAAGLDLAAAEALAALRRGWAPAVVVLTDGRANVARDGRGGRAQAMADALAAAGALRALGVACLLIDAGLRPNPEAARLAAAMGGRSLALPRADAAALSAAARGLRGDPTA